MAGGYFLSTAKEGPRIADSYEITLLNSDSLPDRYSTNDWNTELIDKQRNTRTANRQLTVFTVLNFFLYHWSVSRTEELSVTLLFYAAGVRKMFRDGGYQEIFVT